MHRLVVLFQSVDAVVDVVGTAEHREQHDRAMRVDSLYIFAQRPALKEGQDLFLLLLGHAVF